MGNDVGRCAGVAVVEVLIRGVIAGAERAVADARDHAVLHGAGFEGEVEFAFPGGANGAGGVGDVVGPDIEDLRLVGAGRWTQHREEAGVVANDERDGAVVGVAQGDAEAAAADVDVFGAETAPPLDVFGEAVVEAVGGDVGALFAERVGAFEAEVALVGRGEHAGGAGAAVDQGAVRRAVGREGVVGEEKVADVIAGVEAGFDGGEDLGLGPEREGDGRVHDERVHLVVHRVALGRLVGHGQRDA